MPQLHCRWQQLVVITVCFLSLSMGGAGQGADRRKEGGTGRDGWVVKVGVDGWVVKVAGCMGAVKSLMADDTVVQ